MYVTLILLFCFQFIRMDGLHSVMNEYSGSFRINSVNIPVKQTRKITPTTHHSVKKWQETTSRAVWQKKPQTTGAMGRNRGITRKTSADLSSPYLFLSLSFAQVKLCRQSVSRHSAVFSHHVASLLLLLNLLHQRCFELLQLSTINRCRTAAGGVHGLPLLSILSRQCTRHVNKVKKVKASHTRYRVLGPELIPVLYKQSVIHPALGYHYFLPGLPFQLQSITAPWPVPSYTAWWQRHIGVNNLPKVVTQLCSVGVEFEPTTCWSQVQRCAIAACE